MTGGTNKKHAIDILPPLLLSALFCLLTLLVLLLAANIYSRTTSSADREEQRYLPLTYLQEKLRQWDGTGAVTIEEIDGVHCLLIRSEQGDRSYVNCIFARDGKLWELFTKSSSGLPLSAAESVMPCYGLTMKNLEEGLFEFSACDADGNSASVILSEKSDYGN